MHWRLIVELLWRSAAILAAGELARLLTSRRSAAFRHRVLVCSFALLAILPILSLVLPAVSLLRGPAREPGATVTVRQGPLVPLTVRPSIPSDDWTLLVWLGGFSIALLPLAAGAIAVRRLQRRALRLHDRQWDDLLREFLPPGTGAKLPRLFLSQDLQIPFACGIFEPCILLPQAASSWSPARRRVVLSHELAHLQRHDVRMQFAAHLVAALWWFQPLVWFGRKALRTESELACDAAALASGLRASDYAAELLAIARGAHFTPHFKAWSTAALGIARRRGLETRLRSLLAPAVIVLPSRFRVWGALALLFSVALCAATVTADSSQIQPGGSYMKRSLFSALLVSAGLSAATVSGSLSDPNGAAITNAKVSLSNAQTGEQQQAMSGSDGHFNLDNAPAGAYVLHVEKPGFGSIFRAFNLQDDTRIDVGYTMGNGTSSPGLNKLDVDAGFAAKRIRVGGEVEQSNLVRKVQPVYPVAAKTSHTQGTVELEAVISKEGVPLEIRVVSSPSDDLSESALGAVAQWRYRPVLLNGDPVEVTTTIIVNYTLSQ